MEALPDRRFIIDRQNGLIAAHIVTHAGVPGSAARRTERVDKMAVQIKMRFPKAPLTQAS
jgi:hypothetical protein